jgi:Leucine-rich repeat (LRR) protein
MRFLWCELQENAVKRSRVAVLVLATLALLTSRLSADDKSERDQALEEIKKLKGTVVDFPFSVSFDGKGVTDDDLVHLQKLPDLEAVYLRKCKVTDKGLEKLAGLTKLKYLYLGQTAVTDKGLEQLKGLTKLESLSLVGTQVTDTGLAQLKDLRGLRVLEIKDTKVTEAGVTELKKSLPNLVVR